MHGVGHKKEVEKEGKFIYKYVYKHSIMSARGSMIDEDGDRI